MLSLFGWKWKAWLLRRASLSRPGRTCYRRYQDWQASRMRDADEMLGRALDIVHLYTSEVGDPRGRAFLEVGTGWCPWVPLLLRVAGAVRIVTVDVNTWLSHTTAVRTTKALIERADRVAPHLGVPSDQIRQYLAPVSGAESLQAWLARTGIEYRAPRAVEDLELEGNHFDAVVSSNVLEHVEPAALRRLHRETHRVLRIGGAAVHRFNPQDHFSASDPSITGANFVQYSENEWRKLGGLGLAYHNRLRCPQHAQFFLDAGFEIVHRRTRPDVRAREAIERGQLPVHPDYAGMSPAELTDDYMWIVARKLPDPRTSDRDS